MARGRIITTELLNDPRFNQLSRTAECLFLRAWARLDRDGLITGNLRHLWAEIDRDHIEDLDRMGEYVQEWLASGLVIASDTRRGPVLFFPTFRAANLKLPYTDEAPSQYLPPTGWHRTQYGLIPDNPELAQLMADDIPVHSNYRNELLRHATYDAADHQLVGDEGGVPPRTEITGKTNNLTPSLNRTVTARSAHTRRTPTKREDQDQMNDVDDQIIAHFTPPHSNEGGSGGEYIGAPQPQTTPKRTDALPISTAASTPPASLTLPLDCDHLSLCQPDDLRQAAWELGLALFGYSWTNYQTFIVKQPLAVIIQLLEWIAYYGEATQEQNDRIRDMPAVIRAHLNRNEHAMLRRTQREALLRMVLTIKEGPI